MSTTWYAKIDCNFHANRKALKAGRLGREVYVFVLCVNAQKGSVGILSVDDLELWYLAQQLQMTEAEAREGIDLCVRAELLTIEDGIVSIRGWTEDYAKSPLRSAEKQKQYRDRLKERKAPNQNVTVTGNASNAESNASNALPPVTQEGRKEGREGEAVTRAFDPTEPGALGKLADSVWRRLSDVRLAVAGELRLQGILPLTPITPASSNQRGYRDLVTRLREEGSGAPAIADRILEVLTAQARERRSLDWLSEKAFSEGAWRTARESVPKWRAVPSSAAGKHTITLNGEDIEVEASA